MSITSSEDTLLRRLSLQQLQISRLLEITQAINNNFSKDDLFKIYHNFLTWEMRVPTCALWIRQDEGWEWATYAGVDDIILSYDDDLEELLTQVTKSSRISEPDHPLLRYFHYVIPVYHKDYPLAFALLGEEVFDENRGDLYESVRLISAVTNIIAVAIENKRLFKRQLEQERMKHELELAVQMQHTLLPTKLPENERFEFDGIYQPHKGVGGDYYDFWELGNQIAFCIADISGKGVAAALLMSNFQAILQTLINDDTIHVKDFAQKLNKMVLRATKGDKFITFFMARYCYKTKRLLYLNAGHNPPLMYSNGKIHRLDRGCTVLGAFPKLPMVDYGVMNLEDDALFFLYTDGLTDLKNGASEYFDEKKLETFLNKYHHFSVNELNNQLLSELNAFRGEQEFPDDISVLTGRIFVR